MIWCVEDDASIRDIEVYALQSTGIEARGFEDGTSFWEALNGGEKPELAVIDVMLPGISGIDLLRRMKASSELCDIPVVMATAKDTEYDKITGLDLGADYYLTKPFGVMELVSCVKAVLRRCKPKAKERILKTDGLEVNLDEHTVTGDGQNIVLTYKELSFSSCFFQIRARRSRVTGSWRRFGARTTAARRAPSICTYARLDRSSADSAR